MDDSNIQYLPFHAINEFMLDEYRYAVIEKVLSNLQLLSPARKGKINSLIRNHIKISGFRNSANAPVSLKLQDSIDLYLRNPEFVSHILAGWAELQNDLYKSVYQMLESRGWELLPLELDRSSLPGFVAKWDKEETYDVLDETFYQMFPEQSDTSVDDVRLMVVWISGKLPYELFENGDDDEEAVE